MNVFFAFKLNSFPTVFVLLPLLFSSSSSSRTEKFFNVFERFDVELVLVSRAQVGELHSKSTGDASFVEHVHEEVVQVVVDDVGAGAVLRRRIIAATVVDVKLFDFKRVHLLIVAFRPFSGFRCFFGESAEEGQCLSATPDVDLEPRLGREIGFGFFLALRRVFLVHVGFYCVVDVEFDDDGFAVVVAGESDFAPVELRGKALDPRQDGMQLLLLLQLYLFPQKLDQLLVALSHRLVHRPRAAEEGSLREAGQVSDAAVGKKIPRRRRAFQLENGVGVLSHSAQGAEAG